MKHEFSLSSKLATMDVGHVIYLDDNEPYGSYPTDMERQVTSIVGRSKKLDGRKFRTTRADALVGRRLQPIIRIERTE